MFKRLEASWNARTPKFLHNRTKENLIFQLMLTVLIILGLYAKDRHERYRAAKKPQYVQIHI